MLAIEQTVGIFDNVADLKNNNINIRIFYNKKVISAHTIFAIKTANFFLTIHCIRINRITNII